MINLPNRKHIRLKNYDYSLSGWYYVTICTQNRECLFGQIVGVAPCGDPPNDRRVRPSMVLNDAGKMVDQKIIELKKYQNIEINIYCVMPNHIHFVLIITSQYGSTRGSTPTIMETAANNNPDGPIRGSAPTNPTLGEYIKRFKTLTTKIYIDNVEKNNWQPFNKRLWQRNYYEHIIRNETELAKIQNYIKSNPDIWERDRNKIKMTTI